MKKQTISALILSAAFALGIAAPVRAGVITLPNSDMNSNIGNYYYYDSNDSYDFVSTFPLSTEITTVGTFTYTVPAGEVITGLTVSGTFGNGDSPDTALSEYFLGYNGNETAVQVASCQSITADCYDNPNGPTSWSDILTGSALSSVASALEAGGVDFSYTWDTNPADEAAEAAADQLQFVYAGDPTITIQLTQTPEPATVLICLGGLAGIAALRRFRRV